LKKLKTMDDQHMSSPGTAPAPPRFLDKQQTPSAPPAPQQAEQTSEPRQKQECMKEDPPAASKPAATKPPAKKGRNCQGILLTPLCVLFRKLLTEDEVNRIDKMHHDSLIERWGSRQRRNFGSTGSKEKSVYQGVKTGGHTVTFLEDGFVKTDPALYKFIIKVMKKTDKQAGWNILETVDKYSPRRMEFLQYTSRHDVASGHRSKKPARKKTKDDGLGWHFDTDSLLTFVAMCSDKNAFDGGLLQMKVKTKEGKREILTVPEFDRGDVVVFLSEEAEHRVSPITGGERATFVLELWDQDGYDDGSDTSSGCSSTTSTSGSTSRSSSPSRRSAERRRLQRAALNSSREPQPPPVPLPPPKF